jgi:hypothetical protein
VVCAYFCSSVSPEPNPDWNTVVTQHVFVNE